MEQVIANQSSVLSSAGITLNWDQLYYDLSITDTYPTIKFVELIKSFISKNEIVVALDFTGIQQTTDEIFLALSRVVPRTRLRETIVSVNCTGCTHLTDFGIYCLATALPCLMEVTLDGCHSLTSLSMFYLQQYCNNLTTISALATSVTWLPRWSREISLKLDGCPVLTSPGETQDDAVVESCHKILFLSDGVCNFDIVKFLTTPNSSIARATEESKMQRLVFYPNTRLPCVNGTCNIFEIKNCTSFQTMFANQESIVFVVVDVNSNSNKNPQLVLMNHISNIRAVAPTSSILILCLHNDAVTEEALAQLVGLGSLIGDYVKQQSVILDEFIVHDSYDSPAAKCRDFQTQTNYCRSVKASKNMCHIYLFTINTSTSMVSLKWPIETNLSKTDDVVSDADVEKSEMKTKMLNDLEKVKLKISNLNKSHISELNSMRNPPESIVRVLTSMSILISNGKENNFKRITKDYRFLSNLLSYKVEEVTEEILNQVKNLLKDDLFSAEFEEKLMSQSLMTAYIYQWICAVYNFVANYLLKEQMEKELQLEEQMRQNELLKQEMTSKGPTAILNIVQNTILSSYDKSYPNRKYRKELYSTMQDVESVLLADPKTPFFTRQQLRNKLTVRFGDNWIPDRGVDQILHWLKIQGKILWFSDVVGRPIITNIEWFFNILNKLCSQRSSFYQQNGTRCLYIPPKVPLLDDKALCDLLPDLPPDKVEILRDVLVHYGILLPVPISVEHESTKFSYFMYIHLFDRPYLRNSFTQEISPSSLQFKEKVWPPVGLSSWHSTDLSFGYLFSFTISMPSNLVARVISEWILMGNMVVVWQTGCVARCGAVEILLWQDTHGTQVSNSLYIEARVTKGISSNGDEAILRDYLWGALSRYVLVVECLVNEYSDVHAIVSLPCQGNCNRQGTPKFFLLSELPRQLDLKLQCNLCEENQMTAVEMLRLTFRQRILPFHDWKPVDNRHNVVCPYSSLVDESEQLFDIPWRCGFCGISEKASLRLWTMESSLYPSFSNHSFKIVEKTEHKNEEIFKLLGNVVTVDCRTFENQGKLPKKLIVCKQQLYLNGLTKLYFTVLKPGSAKLLISREFFDRAPPHKLNLRQCLVTYDMSTGNIRTRQVTSILTEHYNVVEGSFEGMTTGDVLSIEVVGSSFVTVTDPEYSDSSEVRSVLDLVFRKNGKPFYNVKVRHMCQVGLLLQGDEGMVSSYIIEAPTYPRVRSVHYPLGSSVLYKTMVGNQWNVGCIVSTANDRITVSGDLSDMDPTKCHSFHPGSTEILPVGQYSESMTIFLERELMKTKDQLIKCIRNSKSWPAPFGLFRDLHESIKDQYQSLRLSLHDSRWCVSDTHCPEVLEQAYLHYMETVGKSQKQIQDWPIILLPAGVSSETLLNPMRHAVQDWSNQELHFICKGSLWTTHSGYQRDTHFLDVSPVPVSGEDLSNLIHNFLSTMLMSCYTMENQKTFLPFCSKVFPKIEASMPNNVVIECLSQLLFVYRSTLLLMQASMQNYLKGKQSKASKAASISFLESSQSDEVSNSYAKNKQQTSGLCLTHSFVSKKTSIEEIINSNNILDDDDDELCYSTCVFHLEASKINIEGFLQNLFHQFKNLRAVNLNKSGLDNLSGISTCSGLQHLFVVGHQMLELPDELALLKGSLESLDVSQGPLKRLPDFITEFRMLRHLKLSSTLVSELPLKIGSLTRLRSLDLAFSPIVSLPESVRKLTNLQTLRLQGVPLFNSFALTNEGKYLTRSAYEKFLSTYPAYSVLTQKEIDDIWEESDKPNDGVLREAEIQHLNQLLFAKFPRFGTNATKNDKHGGVPPQIFGLYRLRTLGLSCHAICCIPEMISRLRRLSILILTDCPYLEELSGGLGRCNLNVLTLENCPMLRTPPKEIRVQGMKTIIAYLKRLSQGSRACHQTKLMIVGLGGVGKTSLVRALMSADYKAPTVDGEGITNGIAISNWSVKRDNVTLTFSIWDFAGQTVYYNTHQFFLSQRAVYVLAWNTRLGFEHAGLDFWLSSICCHCPGTPVLIVGTHADQITDPALPEDQLLKKYPNIVGFFTISAITGQGIRDMLEQLIEITRRQPYIGEMVPEAWLSLERAILGKRNQVSLLDWNTLEVMAQTAGIYGIEIKQAVYFLHDLGTIQYFDNELLRDKVIINPQWIVDVMACLVSVNNNKVIKDGHFKHKDVSIVWKQYPKDLHRWMLKLTEVFDLTYPIANELESIIPCLLPSSEPEFEWPDVNQSEDGSKEARVVYTFAYLPAGLFNRAQVRLYEFSDNSVTWKTGSLLKKNDHVALISQTSSENILVKAFGQRPENIILMIHEVIEGLISQYYTGVQYEYEIPCPDCTNSHTKTMAMFSSKVLRRALELKALFLQCHEHFHTLSLTNIQSVTLPQSMTEYDIQLQRDMQDLNTYKQELIFDLFFMYCQTNIPTDEQEEKTPDPRKVYHDLAADGYKCCFVDSLNQANVSEVAEAIRISKLVVVFISNEFVEDPLCQRMFQFAKETLKKDFILIMIGTGKEWLQSQIGLQVSNKVFVNLQKLHLYEDRMSAVREQIHQKLAPPETLANSCDVFISYCWINSAMAIEAGDARFQEGALGHGDPRVIKQYLENNGIPCWIDVEKVGQMGLFEDIADGMKECKVVVACVSDEYVKSENCKMEFRFAHISLKKPIILAVVGTGFDWESTEVGMLSLGYPKLNFQVANESAEETLLHTVQDKLEGMHQDVSPKVFLSSIEQKEKAFQELFEAIQRKFFRQLLSYVDILEPFPRLFAIDICSPAKDISTSQDQDVFKSVPSDASLMKDDQISQFCIKILCEFEEGWHCVDDGLNIDLPRETTIEMFEMIASYLSKVMSILKHSKVNLKIFENKDGLKLLKSLQNFEKNAELSKMRSVYLAVRQFVIQKDKQHKFGSLKRCYMPSGKHSWLCSEHQKLPRVTVLPSIAEYQNDEDAGVDGPVASAAEYQLIQALKSIRDDYEVAVEEPTSNRINVNNGQRTNRSRLAVPSSLPTSPHHTPHQSRNPSPKPRSHTAVGKQYLVAPIETKSSTVKRKPSIADSLNEFGSRSNSPVHTVGVRNSGAPKNAAFQMAGYLSTGGARGSLETSQACTLL